MADNLDLFWGTSNLLPVALPLTLPKILTVHDLVWCLYPETMAIKNRSVHRLFVRQSVRAADRVISVSESTARDLQRLLGVPEDKIEIIHHGIGLEYKPRDRAAAAKFVAGNYRVSEDYILTVGTIEPRKNLTTLIEAVRILRERGELSFQLLIAGSPGWKQSWLHRSLQQLGLTQNEVRFLGFIPEEDLPAIYCGASMFLFPSLYEGFGLPLAEAMACGVPVIASNTSSIPEVVQDAAVLVSPDQPADFAEAILRVKSDPELRRTMIEKGLRRAGYFRWDKAANLILACMKRLVARGLPGRMKREESATDNHA